MAAKLMIVDGNNLLHRARSGFTLGEHFVAFNFFRGLRALIEKLNPNRVVIALDGSPKRRLELLQEYKANRAIDPASNDPRDKQKLVELADFRVQSNRIIELLSERFPITVMKHPELEADDLIAHICFSSWEAVEITIVSTDTDYIQLLDRKNVQLYNPITKTYINPVDYDYAMWKALKGDTSDNVPGLVSDARAIELVNDGEQFTAWLQDASNEEALRKNLKLIKFFELSMNEVIAIQSSAPKRNWNDVKQKFVEWNFASLVKQNSWDKFVATFDKLFGIKANDVQSVR